MTTQLDCSIGAALETTYGVFATPTKFPEFTDETLDRNPTFVQGVGLRVGSRVPRAARRSTGKEAAAGDFTVEAFSKGMGWILNAAFGGLANTQRGATGVFQQNHTPTPTDYLNSYTLQKGIPLLGGGAATAITLLGAMCSSLQFTISNSGILMLKPTWVAREIRTDQSYAAPSYATPIELFTFVKGALAIGGTIVPPTTTAAASGGTAVGDVVDINCTWDNALDDGGWNLGGAGKRSRKNVTGLSAITGTFTAEYDATTLRDAYMTQADLGLLLTFQGTTVIGSGSDNPLLQLWIPDIRLEGDIPNANAGGVIQQSIGFTGLDALSGNPPITVTYVTTDTAP